MPSGLPDPGPVETLRGTRFATIPAMKLLTPTLGVVLLAAGLTAQTDEASAPKTAAERAQARLEALEKETEEVVAKWRADAKKAREDAEKSAAAGEPIAAISMTPPLKPLVAKFAAAAKEFEGTEHAPQFLVWVVQNGLQFDKKAAFAAFDTLAAHHADAPEIAGIVRMLPFLTRMVGQDKVDAFRTKIEASNKDSNVLGWIAFGKHEATIQSAAQDSDEYKNAKQALLAAADKATDKRLVSTIRGAIDERETFVIGKVAPDIVGIDLDGVEFKLSDYKGKVIFLDFWGDW